MVREAEKFSDEDKLAKEKVEAKNQLESFTYQTKSTLKEENIQNQLTDDEKKTINDALDSALSFSEANPNATKEEYNAKKKELEDIIQPIMTRLYSQGGGEQGGMGGMGGMGGFGGGMGGFPGGMGGFPGGMGGFGGGEEDDDGNGGGGTEGEDKGTGPTVSEVD